MRGKDMYLPFWVFGLGIAFFMMAVLLASWSVQDSDIAASIGSIIGAVIGAGFGTAAILCWRNQWVAVLNHKEFVYSNLFGKRTTYRFSDITGVKMQRGSVTVLLGKKKVFIGSEAILSDRFLKCLEQTLGCTPEFWMLRKQRKE